MGKEPEIPQVQIVSTKKPPGMSFGDVDWPGLRVGLLILVVVLFVVWLDGRINADPQYVPEPEPWPGWPIVAAVVAVLSLMALAYLAARLVLAYRAHRAEVVRAETNARTIAAQDNGLYPYVERNGRLINLNAAPAGVVEHDGAMPDPQTEDRRAAAFRASVVQVAAGSKGRPMVSEIAAPLPIPLASLPEVRVLDGEAVRQLQHLLEGPEEE